MNRSLRERVARGRIKVGWTFCSYGRRTTPGKGDVACAGCAGRRGSGRPRLRWKDCVEIYLGGLEVMVI